MGDIEMNGLLAEVEGSLERLEGERALLASLRPALVVRAVVEPTKLILYLFFIFLIIFFHLFLLVGG